jgi:hypothetical protein
MCVIVEEHQYIHSSDLEPLIFITRTPLNVTI